MPVLKMPQEIEVWYVVPAIRRELAKGLIKKGLKQKEVAGILGVTEAAVSQYMKSKRADSVRFSEDVLEEIGRSVERIAAHKGNVVEEIVRIAKLCRERGILCKVHRNHSRVSKNCRICMEVGL